MATYYETGSAPDVNNLLGKLRTALAANGWTVNYNDFEGASGGMRCHVSKDGMTVNFRTGFNNEVPVAVSSERSSRQGTWSWSYSWGSPVQFYRPNWLAFNVSTGVNLSLSWHNQPGAPGASELKGLGSLITAVGSISRYWLFINEDPDTVLLVAETRPNRFEHIAFGKLVLNQELDGGGGEWFAGSRTMNSSYSGNAPREFCSGVQNAANGSAALFRVVDSRWAITDQLDGWNHSLMTPAVPNSWGNGAFWALVGVPVPDTAISNPSTAGYYNLINQSYLEPEGRSILHPIAAYKYRLDGGLTLVGHVAHIARTSMRPYVAGDPVPGVGETYLAFPNHERVSPWNVTQLGSSPSDPSGETYNYYGTGFAVRKP